MRSLNGGLGVLTCLGCLAVGALVVLACKQPQAQAPTYPVLVLAHTDEGDPLQGVQVSAEGQALGLTDADGKLLGALRGTEGQQVKVSGQCPDHYEGPLQEPTLLLRRFASIDPSAEQRTTVQLTCAASERVKVIALRAGKPNIPVLLHGEMIAQTNVNGTAHVLLRERAGSSLQLTLDTRGAPDLRPESPTRMFAVSAHDDFTVWDQTFEAQPKKVKALRVKKAVEAPPEPPRPIPYRLD